MERCCSVNQRCTACIPWMECRLFVQPISGIPQTGAAPWARVWGPCHIGTVLFAHMYANDWVFKILEVTFQRPLILERGPSPMHTSRYLGQGALSILVRKGST